ncbi:hypothetical protein [Devosia salina]|uniref:Nutrient deprivation-induced protein n=1 Tax=Devosia salina TaxID=2860336 RepID=A0ABX8WAS4_9HYPH|nr:hypothetical protein [Devosia salina]QYO76064.1 hypothetical protein K1X15_15780 [Devosia salina]
MSNDHSNLPGSNPGTSSRGPQDRAKGDIDELSQKAKRDFDAAKSQARQDVEELGRQAKDKMGEATANARSFAEDQKDLAANQITGVADAIRRVADELEGNDQQTIARYARDLAQGLSKVGSEVQQRDTDDLMGAAESFGRSQPVAFLGAAALTGFVASRFALASAHRRASKATPAPTTARPTGPTATPGLERGDMQ